MSKYNFERTQVEETYAVTDTETEKEYTLMYTYCDNVGWTNIVVLDEDGESVSEEIKEKIIEQYYKE